MIIDAHCHTTDRSDGGHPSATRHGFWRYLKRARAVGIRASVVFSTFSEDYPAANAAVARIVQRHHRRLVALLAVHARREAGRVEQNVQRALLAHDFRGLKVHRRDSPLSPEICGVAERLRLPVLYDPMGELDVVRWSVARFPSVTFVVPHLGSFDDDWLAQRGLFALMERHKNVLTDSSGVRCFDLLEEAVQRLGTSRILFGSDGPYLHPSVELAKIRLLRLSPEGQANMTYRNALAVFGPIAEPGSHASSASAQTRTTH